MYTVIDFKTKKDLKEAVKFGTEVRIYAPGLGTAPTNGKATLEGPHFPKPHTWYATATMKDGIVIAVK